jgi:hypothetical protein
MPEHSPAPLSHREPWLLIFAHPGHELRAYHFIERVRPTVFVLTDGSGSTAESRLAESGALLEQAGARAATTFGPLTDREAYAALMVADAAPFLECAHAIADTLVSQGVRSVLVDAAEGYNPVHDVCHWLGRSAVRRARQLGASIDLFELDLIAHPDPPDAGLRFVLDDDAFARKLEATSRYVSVKAETDAAFERYGREAFRVELLRHVADKAPPPASWVPYYEQVGEARVREGRYASVLRYGSHVRRVIDRLLEAERPASYATAFRPLHE